MYAFPTRVHGDRQVSSLKPLARANIFRSSDRCPRNLRCATSRSIQVAAGSLPVEGTAGAQVLRVIIEEVNRGTHEPQRTGEYSPPLHPFPWFPVLPSSSNDVRVHRRPLCIQCARSRYRPERARLGADSSMACPCSRSCTAVFSQQLAIVRPNTPT